MSPAERRHGALRPRLRSWVVLAIGSLGGLVMFLWPLFVSPPDGVAHGTDSPFVFVLILPLVIAVVLADLSSGSIDVKAIAMLGLLAGVGAALRPLGAGTAGIETVFFLLILAGRVYGPGFGFALGSTTLFASAMITGGVGPWLPFQMLAASWVGLGAGVLPRARGRIELALLAAYGAVSAIAYGFLMNMWFWPFAAGTFDGAAAAVGADPGLQFVPGDAVLDNLHRFVLFTVATSTLGWDLGRAVTNVVVIALVGAPVLATLRRAHRKASFRPPVRFVDADEPDEPDESDEPAGERSVTVASAPVAS